MARDSVVGKDCILYYNTATHAAPTWVAIPNAGDVSIPLGKEKAKTTVRGLKYSTNQGAHLDVAFNFDYLHKIGADTVFDAILASFISGTPVEFAAMDQAIATQGSQGLRAFCEVFKLDQTQKMADAVMYSVEAEPTRVVEAAAIVAPDWFDVP